MSDAGLPMMPWFPRDFFAATLGWRFLERGLYRALLDAQWELGELPSDEETLAAIVGMTPTDFALSWPRVSKKFEANASGGLFNRRLEEHRMKSIKIKRMRSEIGRRGGMISGEVRSNSKANGTLLLELNEANDEAKRQANDPRLLKQKRTIRSDPIRSDPIHQKSETKSVAEPMQIPLVAGLNPEAWVEWVTYRAQRKPAIKSISIEKAARAMAALGDFAEQQAAVDNSIEAGYQKLVAAKATNPIANRLLSATPRLRTADEIEADERART